MVLINTETQRYRVFMTAQRASDEHGFTASDEHGFTRIK